MNHKIILILLGIIIFSEVSSQKLYTDKRILLLMSSRFEITTVATDKLTATEGIEKVIEEVNRIDSLISEWNPNSQTSAINRNAGIKPVNVDIELFQLIQRSLKISALTEGAFDISFAGMEKLWVFDKQEHELPDSTTILKYKRFVNWKNIELNTDNHTVFLKEKGMKIGFGGIGQGYAANRCRKILQDIPGIKGALINVSGDILAFGESNHPDGWNVQIADPRDKNKVLAWLKMNNSSLVTSGNYEKYFTNQGKRYSHIINPSTGYPTTEVKSATVLSQDAEISDVLATSLIVLGVEKGLKLINKLKDVECIMIDKNDQIHTSDKIHLNYYQ